MYLEKLYQEMRHANLIASAYEFSRSYLGKSPNYYSVLKARRMEPSLGAVLKLEQALQVKLEEMSETGCQEDMEKLGSLLLISKDVAAYRRQRLRSF